MQRCVVVDRWCRESEGKAKIEGHMSVSDEEAHHQSLNLVSNSPFVLPQQTSELFSNHLVAYSATPGCKFQPCPILGSALLQILCDTVTNHEYSLSGYSNEWICKWMTMVRKLPSHNCQIVPLTELTHLCWISQYTLVSYPGQKTNKFCLASAQWTPCKWVKRD